MDALVVRMALFRSEGAGRELPSFVTIITELSKHDLGELVGEGRRERWKGKERQQKEEQRNCEANCGRRGSQHVAWVGSGRKLLRHDRSDLLPPKLPR